jgi:hypothetical protein
MSPSAAVFGTRESGHARPSWRGAQCANWHLKKSSETQLSEQTGEGARGGVELHGGGNCGVAGGLVTRVVMRCQQETSLVSVVASKNSHKGVAVTESVLKARLCEREEEMESTEHGGIPLWDERMEMCSWRSAWRCARGGAHGDVLGEERMEMCSWRSARRCARGGAHGDVLGERCAGCEREEQPAGAVLVA